MSLRVQRINPKEAIPLRHKVLRPHMTLADCVYPGDEEVTSFHLGVRLDNKLVTVLSVVQESSPHFGEILQFRFRAMATDPQYHGRGFAREVVAAAQKEVCRRGGKLIWFNARKAAFGFYEKMGYQYYGELFEMEGIGPHKVMWKKIQPDIC